MAKRHHGPPWHVAHIIGHMRTGGAERQLLNYLLAADRVDFRHTLICLEKPGELAEAARQSGIDVIRIPVRTRYAPWSIYRFSRWFRQHEVAIVHTHMHHAAMWGRLGGICGGVPVLVTTEHGKELWKGRVRLGIDRILTRYTSRHIAVAQDGRDLRISREGVDPERIVVIPNGVPVPADPRNSAGRKRVRGQMGIGADTPVLGTVGRTVEAKGYIHLIEALRLLRDRMPGVVWLAIGEGDQREALELRAREAGVEDAIIWAGRRDDVFDCLAAMDVWVMSSIREGLPVALLEAMAAAKPIVATRVGGIPDAARDGIEGVLVEPAAPEALCEAVTKFLANPGLAAEFGQRARQRAAADYGIESVARRIEEIYRQELHKAQERT